MSGKNNAKAEMVAIYRMEFYRKQKSWKLFSDVKKQSKKKKTTPAIAPASTPDPPAKPKHTLNETYNVSFSKTDATSLHNNAFIESDSNIAQALEEGTTTTPITEPQSNDTPQSNPPDNRTEIDHKPANTRKPSRIWNIPWSELQEGWFDESKEAECARRQDGWPASSEVWVQTPHTDNTSRVALCGASRDLVDGGGLEDIPYDEKPEADRQWTVAEQLTWMDDYSFCEEQFMIGAHLGPHSTALAQSAEESAAGAVRRLLQLADTRALPSTCSLDRDPPPYNSSYEECPTRDVGLVDPPLHTYSNMTYMKPDLILGGSHKNYVHFDLESISEHVGQYDRNVGQYNTNVGQNYRNVGQYGTTAGQCDKNVGQYDTNFGQNGRNIGQYDNNVDSCNKNDRNVGQYNTNVGKIDRNVGQFNTNDGQNDRNVGQYNTNVGKNDRNVGQFNTNVGQNDRNFGQYDRNVGQYNTNVGQDGRNIGQYVTNVGHNDRNVGQYIRSIDQYTKNVSQYNININDNKKVENYQNPNNKHDANILQYDSYLNRIGFKFDFGQYDLNPELRSRADVDNNGGPLEGRGRGRIRNEVNVIAIGKGRPYRV